MSPRPAFIRTAARAIVLALTLTVAAGCASRAERAAQRAAAKQAAPAAPHAAPRIAAWPLLDMAAANADHTLVLRDESRDVALLPGTSVLRLVRAAQRLSAGAGWAPQFLVAEGRQPNAFAFFEAGRPTVVVTVGMFDLLADDEGAWAALLGHEMAHFALRHRERRAERREAAAAGSSLLGFGLTLLGVPFGGLVGNATSTAVERSYDRDEEREADRAGVALMLAAGYPADGAVRLQQALLDAAASTALPFFATHPGGRERVEDMRGLVDLVRRDGAGALPMPPVVAAGQPAARADAAAEPVQ